MRKQGDSELRPSIEPEPRNIRGGTGGEGGKDLGGAAEGNPTR